MGYLRYKLRRFLEVQKNTFALNFSESDCWYEYPDEFILRNTDFSFGRKWTYFDNNSVSFRNVLLGGFVVFKFIGNRYFSSQFLVSFRKWPLPIKGQVKSQRMVDESLVRKKTYMCLLSKTRPSSLPLSIESLPKPTLSFR